LRNLEVELGPQIPQLRKEARKVPVNILSLGQRVKVAKDRLSKKGWITSTESDERSVEGAF